MKYSIYIFIVFIYFFASGSCTSQNILEEKYLILRKNMVEDQIKARGIDDSVILEAFLKVKRHLFVPDAYKKYSYDDCPLPIGYNQTISQPYVVAYMTEILKPNKKRKVLEIGTGSGYQAAILAELYKEVYIVEIIDSLGTHAKKLLLKMGYKNIKLKTGDGYQGWKEHAPYDAIIVTCAPLDIPAPLTNQLAEGGRMIIPVGEQYEQFLYLAEKINGKVFLTKKLPVSFVPMIPKDKNGY